MNQCHFQRSIGTAPGIAGPHLYCLKPRLIFLCVFSRAVGSAMDFSNDDHRVSVKFHESEGS